MTAAPTGPRYPSPPGSTRWGRAARDAWSVQWRCQVVLAGIGLVVGGYAAVAAGAPDGQATSLVAVVWAAHAVVTLGVGYPVGVLTGRLLPPTPARGPAAWAFALAGAAAGALVLLALGWRTHGWTAVLAWAALGALVAGPSRAWAHRSTRARAEPVSGFPVFAPLP